MDASGMPEKEISFETFQRIGLGIGKRWWFWATGPASCRLLYQISTWCSRPMYGLLNQYLDYRNWMVHVKDRVDTPDGTNGSEGKC